MKIDICLFLLDILTLWFFAYHRKRIKTEEKAKVVAVGSGMHLNAALTI